MESPFGRERTENIQLFRNIQYSYNHVVYVVPLILQYICSFPVFFQTAHEGDVCRLDGAVYQNGETFFPSCKYQCLCKDGQIGCVPRCNLDVMLPGPDCAIPRKIQVPGECCEKWVCNAQDEISSLGGFAMAGELRKTLK